MRRQLSPKRYPPRGARGPLASPRTGGGASIVALALVSVALLALSRLDHPLVRETRVTLADAAAPVLRVAMIPFDPLRRSWLRVTSLWGLQDELARLRADAEKQKGWEGRANELERRLGELEALAKVVPEAKLSFSTVRVIASSTNPFVQTAMIDAGRDHGMKAGFPVINAEGLVGRLLAAGPRASRLLLLSDYNSRVPVMIGANSARALVVGDNGPLPRLQYVSPGEVIKPGDAVVTSGVGGVFPRGLRVGVVVDTGEDQRVELDAHLDRLEYVSVLFYESPGIESAEDAGAARTRARRATAPADHSVATFRPER